MELIKVDPFYISVTFVALVVWFTRLESKTNRNEKDIAEIKKNHDTLESELMKDMSDVKQALARIEGRMGITKE
jgi:hypothetical protein